MLLWFTMAHRTAPGAEGWGGGGWVTVGGQHYTGPGTAEHMGWELPKGRHRRTGTRTKSTTHEDRKEMQS